MQTYLFQFVFREGTINTYLHDWMKTTKTDYFYHHNKMYADLYGIGEYYRVDAEHIGEEGSVFEVYADTKDVQRRNGLERIFPQIAKALNIQEPFRKIRVTFADGEKMTTEIRLCSRKAKEFYLGSVFGTNDSVQHAKSVEFIA